MIALLGQEKPSHQPRRPRADDDGPMPQRVESGRREAQSRFLVPIDANVAGGLFAGQATQPIVFLGQGDLGGVDEVQVLLDAGIEALAQDPPGQQLLRAQPQHPGQMARESGFRLIESQPQIGDANGHSAIVWRSFAGCQFDDGPAKTVTGKKQPFAIGALERFVIICHARLAGRATARLADRKKIQRSFDPPPLLRLD